MLAFSIKTVMPFSSLTAIAVIIFVLLLYISVYLMTLVYSFRRLISIFQRNLRSDEPVKLEIMRIKLF